MRISSLVTDILFYYPSAYLIIQLITSKYNYNITLAFYFLVLFMPSLIVIDHGHFQFNSVMLALSLFSFYFIIKSIINTISTIINILSITLLIIIIIYI